jgi:hypothetical protein
VPLASSSALRLVANAPLSRVGRCTSASSNHARTNGEQRWRVQENQVSLLSSRRALIHWGRHKTKQRDTKKRPWGISIVQMIVPPALASSRVNPLLQGTAPSLRPALHLSGFTGEEALKPDHGC